jgi:hypothetical protein
MDSIRTSAEFGFAKNVTRAKAHPQNRSYERRHMGVSLRRKGNQQAERKYSSYAGAKHVE